MSAATGLSFTHRVNTLARIPRDAATFSTLLSALVEVMVNWFPIPTGWWFAGVIRTPIDVAVSS